MPKLIKLKNKPFWIVTAIILLIGVTFYRQTRKEGFETMFNYVGDLYYGSLSDISGVTSVFSSIIDASSEKTGGDTVWKTGNSAPKSTDENFYIIMALTAVSLNKDDVKKREETDIKNLKTATGGVVVSGVIKDSNGDYLDTKGNKIIGNYIHFLGMNFFKTTFYWIMGGIGALLLLIIVMYMRSSGSSSSQYNNGSYNR